MVLGPIWTDYVPNKKITVYLQIQNKVISANLFNFDFDFEDTIMFGNISVLVTFWFWGHFSFDEISVLGTIQFW